MTLSRAVLDRVKQISKDDHKKVTQWTRYMTVILALVQGIGITIFIRTNGAFITDSLFTWLVSVVTLTAGTMLLMWLGEQINEKGLGNGISLIIFIGIIAKVPSTIGAMINTFLGKGSIFYKDANFYISLLLPITLLVAVVGIVIVTQF